MYKMWQGVLEQVKEEQVHEGSNRIRRPMPKMQERVEAQRKPEAS